VLAASSTGEKLNTKVAVFALFTGAVFLTPAQATSLLFTATTTLPTTNGAVENSPYTIALNDGAGSIIASGYDNVFQNGSGTPTFNGNTTSQSLYVQHDLSGVDGLGVHNTNVGQDNGFIAPSDAILLNFSNVKSTDTFNGQTGTVSKVTFGMYEDYSGADYEVYGVTTTGGHTSYTLIQEGTMHNSTPLTVSTTSLYTSYLIGVTDCALDIESVQVQYSSGNLVTPPTQATPEPGTFVMAGLAMIVLGVTMKKRNRKV
jgi:hypothetical protein